MRQWLRIALVLSVGTTFIPSPAQASEAPPLPSILPETDPAGDFEPFLDGDGRRTVGRFGANLGRNLLGVVSKDSLKPFLLGVGAAGAGSAFDGGAQRFFERHPMQRFGDFGAKLGGASVVAPLAGVLFAAGRASDDPRLRAATYDVAQAFLVNGAYTMAIKYAVKRERPDGSSRSSFPSGHTSNAFAFATVAGHYYGPKLGIPAYALAGLIGVSRIEKRAHHLSDVLAGATLGYVVGRTVTREDGEPIRHRQIHLGPAFAPEGTGVGMAVSFQF